MYIATTSLYHSSVVCGVMGDWLTDWLVGTVVRDGLRLRRVVGLRLRGVVRSRVVHGGILLVVRSCAQEYTVQTIASIDTSTATHEEL